MLKLFMIGVGFATLVGTSYLFLRGAAFYVTVVLSFMFSLGGLVAWHRSDRTDRLKAVVRPLLLGLLKRSGMEAVTLVVEIAKRPGMQNEVVSILDDAIHANADPTERHWLYITLGMIGGKKARSVLKTGLSDENEFARQGAEQALRLLNHPLER